MKFQYDSPSNSIFKRVGILIQYVICFLVNSKVMADGGCPGSAISNDYLPMATGEKPRKTIEKPMEITKHPTPRNFVARV
jgi:hypothetical protein